MSSGVEFEEDKFSYGRPKPTGASAPAGAPPNFPQYGGQQSGDGETKGMAGWMQRHGLAKSSSAAQGILIGIVVINIIITFIVIRYFL